MLNIDEDAILSRQEAADALTKAGYRTSKATLSTLASRGGGPPFRLYGRFPSYHWGTTLAWARNRLSEPGATVTEIRAAAAKAKEKAAEKIEAAE